MAADLFRYPFITTLLDLGADAGVKVTVNELAVNTCESKQAIIT